MDERRETAWARLPGLLALVAALGLRPRGLGRLLAGDGTIDDGPLLIAIWALVAFFVLLGVWLCARPPRGFAKALALVVVIPAALAGTAALWVAREPLPEHVVLMARTERVEAVYLELTSHLPTTLSRDALDLAVPGERGRSLFADEVRVTDLLAPGPEQPLDVLAGTGLAVRTWDHAPATTRARDDLELWGPLLAQVEWFDHAKFYIVRGDFTDEAESIYDSEMGFTGLARTVDGRRATVKAKLHVEWRRDPSNTPPWRIHVFETKGATATTSTDLFFEEVAQDLIPDGDDRRRARRSIHEEYVIEWLTNEDFEKPHPFFTHAAFDRSPALSVVDVDGDGWDDLYLMARWGRNMLLRNESGRSLRDIAPEVGLDLEDHCSAALFADFDGDGDPDVVVGRTLMETRILENDGGRFGPRENGLDEGAPFLVSSLTAADYDLDGHLDLYVSTYAATTLLDPHAGKGARERFLADADRAEYERRVEGMDWIRARVGPPNHLWRNRGDGTFAVQRDQEATRVWRNTYQGAWSDMDADGDPDLYCANDFSTNNHLRNDGGTFVDATAEAETADIGFGMGVAYGDYDNDGDQDLYVTNMFSKAGRRITDMMGELGQEFAPMARGNTLFANAGARFERRSGLDASALQVEAAGWSWGGQFVDVDNDAFLDVYALSGYYTAPDEVAIPVDT